MADPKKPTSASPPASPEAASEPANPQDPPKKKKRHWRRFFFVMFLLLVVGLVIGRLMLPVAVRWYVNRVIDQSPEYAGSIGQVDIRLYRGAYSIKNITISKRNATVPVPLFKTERLDFQLDWDALLAKRVRAQVVIDTAELNFVDAPDESSSQTGAGGPWLQILQDLSPFTINSAIVRNSAIHFRAFQTTPPVDVYLSKVEAEVKNLGNIRDETTPMIAKVDATATAMESGDLELHVGFNPFSYNPSFNLALKLISLDVTKINNLAKAYGEFDFESGYFDLVVEAKAREGLLDGYVKPLFRDLKILSISQDSKEGDPLQFFWEAVIGVTTDVLTNPRRNQFGTVVPFSGTTSSPETDIWSTIGNVLRNAFVRAYLPKLVGRVPDINGLEFKKARSIDPLNEIPPP